jgi:RND family efflux transporter MFP subunit
MSDIFDTARDRDIGLEDFAAELARAVYSVVLRRQPKDSWLNVELALWGALAPTVRSWARQRPAAASADQLEEWRQDLLVELTDNAFHVAVMNGIKGPFLEVKLCLYRAVRLVIRKHSRARHRSNRPVIYRLLTRVGAALVLGLCVGATGCARQHAAAPAAEPPSVQVSRPVEREVTDYADFTARIAAVDTVDVRAHVWGYLEKVNFKEGDLVKKGDVLFELDPRPYEALLNQAKAKVRQDETQLAYDEAEYKRNLWLVGSGAVSRSDLDKTAAAQGVDKANVAADKAMVASNELNLEYTKITAPVSGRISRYDVTVGNLIQSGDQMGGTLLTTIVSVDPMYAYFDVDEYTDQRVRKLVREGKFQFKSPDHAVVPLSLGLATEEGFPHQGTINFADNRVNPKTGTLSVRGVFPNKDRMLTPGYFARVRVPISPPHKSLLVSERALDNDQGQQILYVVNDKNEVISRPVRLGQMHDGLRAIEDGLKPGERVIVNGLQQVRAGVIVEPKLVEMPEVRGQRSEVRGQKSGVRGQRPEVRSGVSGIGSGTKRDFGS